MSALDLQKIREKDEVEMQALFAKLYRDLRSRSKVMVERYELSASDIEDAVNEAILIFYRNLDSFLERNGDDSELRATNYLMIIVRNLLFQKKMKNQRRTLVPEEVSYLPGSDDPERNARLEEFRRQLMEVRLKLTDVEKIVLDGLLIDQEISEIAKSLNVTPSYVHTIKGRLTRRIRALIMVPTAKTILSSEGKIVQ